MNAHSNQVNSQGQTKCLREVCFDQSKQPYLAQSQDLSQQAPSNNVNLDRYKIKNLRLKVGIMLETISKISDSLEQQKEFKLICPCQAKIECHLCSEAYHTIPEDIESLEEYVSGSTNHNIRRVRDTQIDYSAILDNDAGGVSNSLIFRENLNVIHGNNSNNSSMIQLPNQSRINQSGPKFEEAKINKSGTMKSLDDLQKNPNNHNNYREYLVHQAFQKHQVILQAKQRIIQSGSPMFIPSSYAINKDSISPFQSCEVPKVPVALYFDILCQKLKVPDEHAIVILALVERLYKTKSQNEIQKYVNTIIYPNDHNNSEQKHSEMEECSMFENPAIFWTGEYRMSPLLIHRLILAATLVTHKFYSDFYYKNSMIAMSGGMYNMKEANLIETAFLDLINWKLVVSEQQYKYYKKGLTNYFNQSLPQVTKDVIDGVITFIQSLPSNQSNAVQMQLEIGSNVADQQENQMRIDNLYNQRYAQQQNNQNANAVMEECEIPDERPEDIEHPVHNSNSKTSKLLAQQPMSLANDLDLLRSPDQIQDQAQIQGRLLQQQQQQIAIQQLNQVQELLRQKQFLQNSNQLQNQFIQNPQPMIDSVINQQQPYPNMHFINQQQMYQQIQQQQPFDHSIPQFVNPSNMGQMSGLSPMLGNQIFQQQSQASPLMGQNHIGQPYSNNMNYGNNQQPMQSAQFSQQIPQQISQMDDQHIIHPSQEYSHQYQPQSPGIVQQQQYHQNSYNNNQSNSMMEQNFLMSPQGPQSMNNNNYQH